MTELPPVIEKLLLDVVADGFTIYCCGPRTAPTALAACYEWADYADLLTIWSWELAVAARVPRLGWMDVFGPEVAVWAYQGPAEHTVRALLDLVHPDAPTGIHPAPRWLRVPRRDQRPLSIQLPSASHAGARAARLAGLATSAHEAQSARQPS